MDTQRLIAFIVFSFSAFLLWDAWQKHINPVQAVNPAAATHLATTPQTSATANVPSSHGDASRVVEGKVGASPDQEGSGVSVRTDKFDVELNTLGGDIHSVTLREHMSSADKTQPLILLQSKGKHYFVTQSGLLEGLPNHNSTFHSDRANYELTPGMDKLEVRFTNQDTPGIKVAKLYTFRPGSYVIDVEFQISNETGKPITPVAYFQFIHDSNPPEGEALQNSMFTGVATFTGPAVYTEEKKFNKIAFSDIDKGKQDYPRKSTDGWLAMVQHYFVSAWLPKQGVSREYFTRKVSEKYYAAGIIVASDQIDTNKSGGLKVPLYIGPQEQSKLKDLAPGFDLVVDYGWATVLAVPLFLLLKFIDSIVDNWGWAIVIMTVLIRLVFFPLNQKAGKSMAHMKAVAPRMKQIQERYADDKAKQNQAMMELYRTEKINPLGGCLPMVVQIPVFIALYYVLIAAIELRHTPWMGWIQDLSAPDPYYILPLIMAISMFIQSKLNPPPADPMQAKMMLFMPMLFSIMFFFFPSGLVLYYTVQNILGILQQWWINKTVNQSTKIHATSKH
jgi:YidC/Oxa1 family membrane protein insertase